MKKLLLLLGIIALATTSGCSGPEGPQGATGYSAESEVLEMQHVNFDLDANGYFIRRTFNTMRGGNILNSDNVLIYRMTGTVNAQTPIWQSIPNRLFLQQGELDYDFDFTQQDFTIMADGTYNLGLTPAYINDQTFRIVIIPGYFGNRNANASAPQVDLTNYNDVIRAYHIDESKMIISN